MVSFEVGGMVQSCIYFDKLTRLVLLHANISMLVVQVRVEDGEWVAWSESVPKMQLEPHRIVSSDVVITTTDTVR